MKTTVRFTWNQLRIFDAVARHASHTRAAAELHVVQPTISAQIKQLTDAVGMPLFEQIGKKIFLTPAGRELHATCGELFDCWSRFEMKVADIKGIKTGTLRVAIVTTSGGSGVLMTDTCDAHGMVVPQFADATIAELRTFLPSFSTFANPADFTAQDASGAIKGCCSGRLLLITAVDGVVDRGIVKVTGNTGISDCDETEPRILDALLQRLSNDHLDAIGGFLLGQLAGLHALGHARLPVARPCVVERMVAANGLFVGEEERGLHRMPLQDAGDGLGLRHGAGVEGQVDRAAAAIGRACGRDSGQCDLEREEQRATCAPHARGCRGRAGIVRPG